MWASVRGRALEFCDVLETVETVQVIRTTLTGLKPGENETDVY